MWDEAAQDGPAPLASDTWRNSKTACQKVRFPSALPKKGPKYSGLSIFEMSAKLTSVQI